MSWVNERSLEVWSADRLRHFNPAHWPRPIHASSNISRTRTLCVTRCGTLHSAHQLIVLWFMSVFIVWLERISSRFSGINLLHCYFFQFIFVSKGKFQTFYFDAGQKTTFEVVEQIGINFSITWKWVIGGINPSIWLGPFKKQTGRSVQWVLLIDSAGKWENKFLSPNKF